MAQDTSGDVWNDVEHKYADSNGVKIHYAALSPKGGAAAPLVVMIHGFPDFWYSWRKQMRALADNGYRAVAVDLRGYNLSDKPKGVDNYAMPLLVSDIAAVVKAEGAERAVIVGHDWGGSVAWNVAMRKPEITELLIICNLPHPAGIAREIASNPEQKKNSEYAFKFQQPDAHKAISLRAAHAVGHRSRRQAALSRSVPEVGRRGHVELLQGQLSQARRATAARELHLSEGEGAGADVSWTGRSGAVTRRAQRHVAMGREGPDHRDHPGREPFRAAGRCRYGQQHDGRLAGAKKAEVTCSIVLAARRSLAGHARAAGGHRSADDFRNSVRVRALRTRRTCKRESRSTTSRRDRSLTT